MLPLLPENGPNPSPFPGGYPQHFVEHRNIIRKSFAVMSGSAVQSSWAGTSHQSVVVMFYSFRGLNFGHRGVEFGSQERALAFADILSEAWRCGVVVKVGSRLLGIIYHSDSGIRTILPPDDTSPINLPEVPYMG